LGTIRVKETIRKIGPLCSQANKPSGVIICADAASKAATAKSEAIADADAKFVTVNAAIDAKVAKADYNAKVGELTQAITDAISTAAADATTKANAAQAAAEATAASALSGAKTELEGKINAKVSTETFNAQVALLETKEDAASKLTAAKTYTNEEIAKVNTKIGEVEKDLEDEAKRADEAEKALGLRIDGVQTSINGINTTIESLATKAALANQKTELETFATTKANAAETAAKGYTDT
jgi:hypothetical protein